MAGILRRVRSYFSKADNLLLERHSQLEVFTLLRLIQHIQTELSSLSVLINALLNLFGCRVLQEISSELLWRGLDLGFRGEVGILNDLDTVVEIVVHILRGSNVVEGIGFNPFE